MIYIYMVSNMISTWLVYDYSQHDYSQYMGKNVPNHQPGINIYIYMVIVVIVHINTHGPYGYSLPEARL